MCTQLDYTLYCFSIYYYINYYFIYFNADKYSINKVQSTN